jgi:hypothetical protein
MRWVRQVLNNTDLALGLVLSVVLGSVIGLAMSHPLGHLILGSALGGDFPAHLYGVIQPRSPLDDGNSAGANCYLGVCLVCHPQLVAEPEPRDLISSALILTAVHGRRTRLHLLARPHGTGG